MKTVLLIPGLILVFLTTSLYAETHLNVVTTLPDYAFFAKEIGAKRVSVKSIVRGNQDAHFIRPKPSFATALREADVFVATGFFISHLRRLLVFLTRLQRLQLFSWLVLPPVAACTFSTYYPAAFFGLAGGRLLQVW